MKNKKNKKSSFGGIRVHTPKTKSEFSQINGELNERGYVALDVLRKGHVRDVHLALADAANAGAQDMATCMGGGSWSNGPLLKVAWAFDGHTDTVEQVKDKNGEPLGLGYVKWGAADNIPSVIPPLAMSSPYTASPLRYLADLTAGLGPRLMYAFDDDTLCEYRKAGYRILERIEILKKNGEEPTYGGDLTRDPLTGNLVPIGDLQLEDRPDPILRGLGIDFWKEAYREWQRTWEGYNEKNNSNLEHRVPGAREFLEENNLNFHISQCMQDDVMLDMYFPTVGFDYKGYRRDWRPVISKIGFLPASSSRLERMNDTRHINHVFFSDSLRTKGAGDTVTIGNTAADRHFTMYQAAMPQHLLHDLRYIVESNQKKSANSRPMWVVCPTFYPSGNKNYYPQPAWWSIFTSKAFDFSATILYDKYKQRENATSWGRIIYISLDYLDRVFGQMGIEGNPEEQEKFVNALDNDVEQFLQQRENNGKMMRQWMWLEPDGKEHRNVEIVDVAQAKSDVTKAGKEELELSTSPIFLALGVDPRLVGVPMVSASNGGTALREMHLLKQQQLNVKQRLYESFLNAVATFNKWDPHAVFKIVQQTLTTLDASKTGTKETIAGEGA